MPIKRENVDLKLASVVPYAKNARTHSEIQVMQIVASMKEFGFTNPCLVDEDNNIIAGHGRILAAEKLKMDTVPCVRLSGLSANQKKALVLADNKLALNAGWDDKILLSELNFLDDAGYDFTLTGFSEEDMEMLGCGEIGNRSDDEDETPEVPENPRTVLGDVWICGDHRIMCGDSTSASAVEMLLQGAKPHLMVTDPPYGVEYDANWRNERARNSTGMGNRAIGAGAVGKVLNDDRADWREAWALFPGNIAYVWHAGTMAGAVAESLAVNGYKLRAQIIWAKQQFAIGRGDYHFKHEPCWYAVKGTGNWTGDRKQTTLWEIDKPQKSETGHSTQKPVECMRRPLLNNSNRGDSVYDPFLGSGTTVIAAAAEGRICYGMELNPAYVDVSVKRWQDYTGEKAVHAATGEAFDGATEKPTKAKKTSR